MNITELAEVMKLKETTIRKYVLENSIPFIKIGAAVRFRPSEIEQWIEARKRNSHLTAVKK
jgi:excisionase family DNA binding protein